MSKIFISPTELQQLQLASANSPDKLAIVDVSWFLPELRRDANQAFLDRHIPGAVRFDLDADSRTDTMLPHMLPRLPQWQEVLQRLGIGPDTEVIAYEQQEFFAAPRFYWMMQMFAFNRIKLLAGGLRAWCDAGLPVATGAAAPVVAVRQLTDLALQPELVISSAGLNKLLSDPVSSRDLQIIDTRPNERFIGAAPEPRPRVRCGNIPGSINLPFTKLANRNYPIEPVQLRQLLQQLKINFDRPIICSCGSGVTASILFCLLRQLGKTDVTVFDGSWAELGSEFPEWSITGIAVVNDRGPSGWRLGLSDEVVSSASS